LTYKTQLKQIDHDCCANDPDDGCSICAMIDEMTEAEAKEKLEWLRKNDLVPKGE